MRTSFSWWIAKAVLSAVYWMVAAYLIAPMMFGDRVGADGAILPGLPVWAGWAAVIVAVLLYAFLSHAWNRAMARERGAL